ncbi:uncharacterized protein FIBRA_00568 [Fibroporia radiculosa]|uniref:Uncharacterized protein n=1 Tax=Fibroporia radiculosa TaxID=599839 RepID=J4G0F4_9APHY|nr:uncharacterized protein FIBRA_00568 [Fibroporia radiculosa]CCL98568.1 predicted protein [Fibroporia radiculosa]
MYVVLFCGIQWGPHDTSPDLVVDIIRDMFDSGNDIRGGGIAKRANKFDRVHTREFVFKSHGLHRWLNTAREYNSPLKDINRGEWTDPSHLNNLWNDVLKEQLEKNDRMDHRSIKSDLPGGPQQPMNVTGSYSNFSSNREAQESVNSASLARKRARIGAHFGQDVSANGEGSKRRRITRSMSRGNLVGHASSAEARPVSSLKRSTRNSGRPGRSNSNSEGTSSMRHNEQTFLTSLRSGKRRSRKGDD